MSAPTRNAWLARLLIAAVAVFAYWPSFAGVFVFDDFNNIVNNPFIHRLWPPGPALWASPGRGLHGRPVVAFSLALDWVASGGATWSFHATNLAIHVLCGWLLHAIVGRALNSGRLRERFAASANGLALAIALIWIAHPLTTSAVTFIVQRCESLMSLFLLLALYAAQRAFEDARARWVVLATFACVLGAGCKEVIVVAPLVVLAYEVAVGGRRPGQALRAHRAVYAGLFASWAGVAAMVIWSGGHATSVGLDLDYADASVLGYVQVQAVALVKYLRLAFWPHPLILDYGWPPQPPALAWIGCGALVLALLAATARALARRRPSAFPAAWSFLILAPSSSVLPIVSEKIAEFRMYAPLAGIVVLVVGAAHAGLSRVSSAALRRALAWSATGALTLALALATRARNDDWSSEERLWQGVLAHVPDNPRAHDSLGDLRRRAGRLDEARAFFAEAVRLQPRFAMWRNNYGSSLYAARDLDGALEQFRTAVELEPGFALARANLGLVMYEKGRLKEAVDLTREALRTLPDHVAGYRTLAFALADLGESAEAAGYLRGVVKANPADLEAARKLIEVLATSTQAPKRCGDEAVARSEQLQAQLPTPDALWLSAFAAAYAQAAQWDRAFDLQSKARDRFNSSNDAASLAEATRRLTLYQSHQPLRR